MKQRIFTLVMMLALVIVTGSAFGANGDYAHPYIGATKSYTLPVGIADIATGSVSIYLNTDATSTTPLAQGATAWVSSAGVVVPATNAAAIVSNKYVFDLVTASTSIAFDIAYGSALSTGASTDYYLHADITAGGCTNHIILHIDLLPVPVVSLLVTADDATKCQTIAPYGTLATNVSGETGQTTGLIYTVTPTGLNAGATYGCTINLSNTVNGAYTFSITSGTANVNSSTGVITVATGTIKVTATFNDLAEVLATNVDATLTATNGVLSVSEGSVPFTPTVTAPSANNNRTTVNPTPQIGTFNGN